MRFLATCVALAWLMLAGGAGAQTLQHRVALVIGNAAYAHVPKLSNPGNDAKLLATTLASLGFEVVGGGAQLNLTAVKMREALRAFGQKLGSDTVAVFYYSGHGVEYHGENFLVPVDADIHGAQDVDFDLVSANLLLRQIAATGSGMSMVILDACRSNPFGRGLKDIGDGGLAEMRAPRGTLIAYATAPGEVALDGSGANSPFALALADQMKQPGLDILNMFNRVALQVDAATNHAQQPWTAASPIAGAFSFGGAGTPPPPVTPAPAPVQQALAPAPPPPPVAEPPAQLKECTECPEMLRIPAGGFTMGVPEAESQREGTVDWDKNARPLHTVRIGQAFYLGRYLVTRGEYRAFATATGRNMEDPGFPQDDRHPAVNVSWDDARAYAAWLSQRTGKPYRLPSESEWEYAARAGTTTARYWGDGADRQCQYAKGYGSGSACNEFAGTSPVGHYRPNGFGLYDMLGNAWEWMQDCYDEKGYGGAPTDGSAQNTGTCSFRVLRGGSWDDSPGDLRAGNRLRFVPAGRDDSFGLRVARTLTP